MNQIAQGKAYSALMLVAVLVSAWLWRRRQREHPELPLVYLGGLLGALLGAKLVYFFAEGWLCWGQPDQWRQWLTGKSVTGALLGGYVGVEGMKSVIGYRRATGDVFAMVVPVALLIGRMGCLTHGCCPGRVWEPAWYTLADAQGIARWPAVPLEMAFNLLFLAVLPTLRKVPALRGQCFHLYLIAYGLFRFAHEFVRATPKVAWGVLSGYHVAALALIALGAWRFLARRQAGA